MNHVDSEQQGFRREKKKNVFNIVKRKIYLSITTIAQYEKKEKKKNSYVDQ